MQIHLPVAKLDRMMRSLSALPGGSMTLGESEYRAVGAIAWLLFILCLGASTSASALISFVGADLPAGGSSSTITFSRAAIPAATGDIMLVMVTAKQATKSGARTITAPTGAGTWTSINLQNLGNSVFRQEIFWKAIGASDPTTYQFTTSYSEQVSGVMVIFGGVDTTSPIIASGGQQNASSTTITAPSVSSGTTTNSVLVNFFGTADGRNNPISSTATAPPTTNVGTSSTAGGAGGVASSIAYQFRGSLTGPTGIRTATVGRNAVSAGQSLVLRPARSFLVEASGGGNIGTQIAGTDFSIIITARNPDNTTDTTFTGTATISSDGLLSAGSGVTASFVAGVLASHTVRMWNTGTFAITATQTAGSAAGTSNSFVVVPKLQILVPGETAAPVAYTGPAGTGKTGSPSNQTAGTAFTVTVNAVDEGWNVVTSATDTISITSSDSAAALPPSAALASGTRDFSVVLNTAPSQTVTAYTTAPTRISTSAPVPVAAAVVGGGFNACDVGTPCTNASPSTYVHTKLVGVAFSLDLVALKTDGSRNTSYNNTVSVELLNSSDNSGALDSDQCRSSWINILTLSPNPSFSPADNGLITVGPFTISNAYREVRVRVTNVGGPSRRSCSTDNFAIRPTAFAVSSTNAIQNGTSGAPAIKTGANFNLTAASVAGYDGAPSIDNTKVVGTPTAGAIGGNFSAAPVASGTASGNAFFYSEVGNFGINANAIYDSTFTGVDQPGGCTADFSNTLVGGKYGCSFGSAAVPQSTGSSGFGRFIPDNFNVSYNTPTFAAACGFVYVGAPFSYGVAPVITVSARNGTSNGLSNATTTNYAGAYMKLTNASLTPATQDARYSRFDALGGGATPALDTTGLPSAAGDPVIGTFSNGIGTLTFGSGTGLVFARSATAPNAPFDADIALGLNVIDTDGVVFAGNPASFGTATSGNGIAFNTDKRVRYGRLRLSSAYGSELLDIRVPVTIEYVSGFNGAAPVFATNALDSCTSIPNAAMVLGNRLGGLTVGNMGSSHLPGSPVTLSGGSATIIVTKPSPAAVGTVDLAINLGATGGDANCIGAGMTATGANLSWLRANWCGGIGFVKDPNARLTFGTSRSPFIYLREMY